MISDHDIWQAPLAMAKHDRDDAMLEASTRGFPGQSRFRVVVQHPRKWTLTRIDSHLIRPWLYEGDHPYVVDPVTGEFVKEADEAA